MVANPVRGLLDILNINKLRLLGPDVNKLFNNILLVDSAGLGLPVVKIQNKGLLVKRVMKFTGDCGIYIYGEGLRWYPTLSRGGIPFICNSIGNENSSF